MAAKTPESLVVAAIIKAIYACYPDAYVIKIFGSMYQATGFPDIMAFVNGKGYGLEVKKLRAGEKPERARMRSTRIQRLTIHKLRRAGVVSDVVLSPAEALAVIQSDGRIQFLTDSELLPEPLDKHSEV